MIKHDLGNGIRISHSNTFDCGSCGTTTRVAIWTEAHDAVARVRRLHRPIDSAAENYPEWLVCAECSILEHGRLEYVDYPCATIRALDGEQS